MQLSERTILAALHISAWSGQALDRKITDEVSTRHDAEPGAGHYTKQLVSRKALHGVMKQASAARTAHRILTLPWGEDGTRILTTAGYQGYTEAMYQARIRFEGAVEAFLSEYPEGHLAEARQRLKTMFNKDEYPPLEEIKERYKLDVEIMPVPEKTDFRAQLSNESVKTITKDIERRTKEKLQQALNNVFERVKDVTGNMAERLRAFKPHPGVGRAEGIFRDTLVSNVKELADLLPMLNLTEDPRIDRLRDQLLNELTVYPPQQLREDTKAREATARKAEAVLAKVSSYLS